MNSDGYYLWHGTSVFPDSFQGQGDRPNLVTSYETLGVLKTYLITVITMGEKTKDTR